MIHKAAKRYSHPVMKKWVRWWWHWFLQGVKILFFIGVAMFASALVLGGVQWVIEWMLSVLAEKGLDLLWLGKVVEGIAFLIWLALIGRIFFACHGASPVCDLIEEVEIAKRPGEKEIIPGTDEGEKAS